MPEEALDMFYLSKTYENIVNPEIGLQLMSDGYILEDLESELHGRKE